MSSQKSQKEKVVQQMELIKTKFDEDIDDQHRKDTWWIFDDGWSKCNAN